MVMSFSRLLIVGSVVALVAAGGGAWWVVGRAGDSLPLPTPPEPPRLIHSPEYERCLEMAEEDPEGARSLAESWTMEGGGEAAAHCMALATLSLGDAQRAAETLERIAIRSQAWIAAGRPDRAHAALTLALALTPADADLLTERALASLTLDRPRDALADADAVLARDPSRAEAWVLRASALRRLDRLPPATESIARAIALAPRNTEALLERGIIRQTQGDSAGARADWEMVMELDPDGMAADLAAQNMALMEAGPAAR
jgi:tetratricopeptide (TPR) repeat protein